MASKVTPSTPGAPSFCLAISYAARRVSTLQTWTYRPQKRQDGSAFALTYILRFIASPDPSATLSSSADFPGLPVIRPTLLRRFLAGTRRVSPGQALVLEDVPVPDTQPDEILVQVTACGMCRSDVQLVDGYFRKYADIPTPITLGHEITGIVHKIGGIVPKSSGFQEGDHVVVVPGWGDGTCRHCQIGNTHICPNVRWPGFGPYGGFAEFIPVPARYLIKVDSRLKFEELAPLTDAGLTPYRGIKKLRDAGALGPNRVFGVFGVGGVGEYAVQYAKLLGSGAKVVAIDRNDDKLNIARQYGADYVINDKGKSS